MWDYYSYLLQTTWTYLSVFCGIWGFVLCRMAWKFWSAWRAQRKGRSFLWLGGKALVWTAVLAVYTNLLLISQPDWLSQPGRLAGTVTGKSYDTGVGKYVLTVGSEEGQGDLFIDHNVYDQLNVNDQVNLLYLPVRREVVSCALIERSVDSE